MVRSLAVGDDGAVYVGGVGGVGVLSPDTEGSLRYASLRSHIAPEERDFGDVWTTHATPEGVVFQTSDRLFRWDGRAMTSWSTATRFRSTFLVSGRVYVWEEEVGLKVLEGGRLRLIPGGSWFSTRKVDALLLHRSGLLAVVRDVGLVRVADGDVQPLEGTGSDYLRRYRPYAAVPIPDRYSGNGVLYAVATFGGGVAVVAPDGRLVRVYREDVGLSGEDSAVGLHVDRQGGLWVALLNGILRVDLTSRFTLFDERVGLSGSVYAFTEAAGQVYAGTSMGLFRLVPGNLGRPGDQGRPYTRFERVAALPDVRQTWALQPTLDGLLVATGDGVFDLAGARARRVTSVETYTLLQPEGWPGRLLVGTANGVSLLERRGGAWQWVQDVEGIVGEARALVDDPDGSVWASQLNGNVYRLTQSPDGTLTARSFGPDDGLTVSAGPLLRVGGDVWMATREGTFEMLSRGGRLRLEPVKALRDISGGYGLFPVDEDQVWLSHDGAFRAVGGGGLAAAPFELRGVQVNGAARSASGVMWVATADGLLRYDPRVRTPEAVYPAFVRRLTDGQRRTLWGGAGQPAGGPFELAFSRTGELRFEAAAAFFDAPDAAEYQFFLDGFDETWGAWGPERVRSFTNLPEGRYTLRVRARDAFGHLSETAAFPLHVFPPWYRTWWAYLAYALALGGTIWGASAWRIREHRVRLDAQRARSARLQRLSARLEKTNERLRQADKLKDDLLANTSHELRTPLTAVLGYSEMLMESASDEVRDLAEGVQRGGRRLLSTVNGLLDMYKLQSGTLSVVAEREDAAQAVRDSVDLLQPLAASRGLDLVVFPEDSALPATVDTGLLDRIVTNLVSNAIKFTEQGRVLVLVDGDDEGLRIVVRDTGIGIHRDDVDRMFEPFEQASTGFSRTHEGTGLGLAIVKRVVDQLGGQISVESAVGVGTTFTVLLPRHWGTEGAGSVDLPVGVQAGLEGAHLLAVGLGPASEETLRRWIEPHGSVSTVDTPGKALREARKNAYDLILLAAGEAEAERKRVQALRAVPGYRHTPIARVGGEPLSASDLEARGLSHQVEEPLGPELAGLVEAVLLQVEAAVEV